jgi:hypothetical protein
MLEFSAYEKSMISHALAAYTEENLFWRHLEYRWSGSGGVAIMMRDLLPKIRTDIIMPEFS